MAIRSRISWKDLEKNAKCVKYCADKYEFFRALHDGGRKREKERVMSVVEALHTKTALEALIEWKILKISHNPKA